MIESLNKVDKEQARRLYRIHLEKLEEQVRQEKILAEIGIDVDLPYLAPSLHSMYDMLMRYDQFGDFKLSEGEHYRRVTQVIKVTTRIPADVINIHNPERVVIAGLFVVADVYILSAEALKLSGRKGHRRALVDPELFGLPTFDEVNYGTRKELGTDTYVALAADHWLSDYITATFHYDYPTLNLAGPDEDSMRGILG